jgi:ribosomal-protein-alanine N-acetyltransferase
MLDLTHAFATFPVLHTERMNLRAVTEDDAPDIFRIMADPLAMRYFGRVPMTDLSEAVQRAKSCEAAFQECTGIRWALALKEQAGYIGSCGYWRIVNEHHRAEIGYELAPECWGRGLMPEALAAILHFGFSLMGLHSVEANIHPDNIGSRRVLEKLGFVQEGYFRENFREADGSFSDSAIFSLLRPN